MQTKEQKISPIKQRILWFVDNLGISKRDFYAKIGVSRGTLESKTGITEDVLAKFIATFPEISLDWLLLNHGPMLRSDEPKAPVSAPTIVYERDPRDIELIDTQKEMIADKNKIIQLNDEVNASLRRRIGELESRGFRTGAIPGVQPADIPIISPETTPRRK